jgi:hypothetical protein
MRFTLCRNSTSFTCSINTAQILLTDIGRVQATMDEAIPARDEGEDG